MKTSWTILAGALALGGLMAGCGEDAPLPSGASSEAVAAPSLVVASGGASELRTSRNFRAHLSGREQVPPRDVLGQGQAIFNFSKDAETLEFKINVANVKEVIGLHIHLAPPGVNGPIVLGFIGDAASPFIPPPGITVTGTIVEGTATAADLSGPLAGMTLEDLANAMASGETYVNLHTVQFRPGEIRGQIR